MTASEMSPDHFFHNQKIQTCLIIKKMQKKMKINQITLDNNEQNNR